MLNWSLPEILRLVAVGFLVVALGSGCVTTGEVASDLADSAIVYGLTRQPAGLDPHLHRDAVSGLVARQVYDTLLYRHPLTRELVGGLAQEWSLAPDGRILRLTLRGDVLFHDGGQLNAAAVEANLARILDAGGDDPVVRQLRERFIRAEVVDALQIDIVLQQPWIPLLDALTQPGFAIASPAALNQWSDLRYQFNQVGSGPFRFVEYIPGERIVIQRNPEYSWGPEFFVAPDQGGIQTVEFRFLDTTSRQESAVHPGETDLAGNLSVADSRNAEAAGMRLEFVPVPGQPLMFQFNTSRSPTNLRALRQALIFLANRNAIANAGGQLPAPLAWGPLSESTRFFYGNLRGLYSFNRQLAGELLEQAGAEDSDGDGWLELGGAPLHLDILVTAGDSFPQATALLREQWRDAGIRSRLVQVPTRGALLDAIQGGAYHLVASAQWGFDPAWLGDYFGNEGASNWNHSRDEELNAVLQEAVATADDRLRFSLYVRAQQIIMDQALILPLHDQVNVAAVAEGLGGLLWDVSGLYPWLHNLYWVTP